MLNTCFFTIKLSCQSKCNEVFLKNHAQELFSLRIEDLNTVLLRTVLFTMINSTASDTLTNYFNFFIRTTD